jgi:hypothetical protein
LSSQAGANATHVFAHSGDAVVGSYIGSDFGKSNMATAAIQTFIEQYSKSNLSESILIQLCGAGMLNNAKFRLIGVIPLKR